MTNTFQKDQWAVKWEDDRWHIVGVQGWVCSDHGNAAPLETRKLQANVLGAAPDLLEACLACLKKMDGCSCEDGTCAFCLAFKASAKAEGDEIHKRQVGEQITRKPLIWKGEDLKTMGDCVEAMVAITTGGEAQAFKRAYLDSAPGMTEAAFYDNLELGLSRRFGHGDSDGYHAKVALFR